MPVVDRFTATPRSRTKGFRHCHQFTALCMPTLLPWVIYLQCSPALPKSAQLQNFNTLTHSSVLNFATISPSTPNNSVETNPVYTQSQISTATVSTTNYVQQIFFTKSSKARRPSTFLCFHSPAPSIIITASSQQHSTHKNLNTNSTTPHSQSVN